MMHEADCCLEPLSIEPAGYADAIQQIQAEELLVDKFAPDVSVDVVRKTSPRLPPYDHQTLSERRRVGFEGVDQWLRDHRVAEAVHEKYDGATACRRSAAEPSEQLIQEHE